MTTPPWLKLHREERGSFAQLPLLARALFCEILKLTDDDGRIGLGGKAPWDAIAFALGADRSDRRALRKYVPMLLEDGCLVLEDDELVAPNWGRFQGDPPARKRPRRAAKRPRSDHEATTTVPRTGHERVTNDELSDRNHSPQIDREDKIREETPPTPSDACVSEGNPGPRFHDPLGELEDVSAGQLATRMWVLAMRELGGGHYDEMLIRGTDRQRLSDMTQWARDTAAVAERHGGDWAEEYFRALRGSLLVYRDEYQRRPDATPLSPGGWWARRDKWRQAA